MPAARRRLAAVLLASVIALPVLAVAGLGRGAAAGAGAAGRHDPCHGRSAHRLLCPNLRVARPHDLQLDRETRPGRVLLRAASDLESRGRGPMELRGHRYKRGWMHVEQAIHRRGGGRAYLPTPARLHFFDVGYAYGGGYWKARDPVRFELWRLGGRGRRLRRVRLGPKQFYCFRDLERTDPGPRSPRHRVYPACSQDPSIERVTLGTSVGWSDVYPATYDLQWIDVTGLRGCFAYVLRVDPKGYFHETSEGDNLAQRAVRLPFRRGDVKGRCGERA